MALQPFFQHSSLLQFRNHFPQTVGLLGRVISPAQGPYLHTGQHKQRIKAHTDIHALIGIRTRDPSILASEDSSCLRPRGHCERRLLVLGLDNNECCQIMLQNLYPYVIMKACSIKNMWKCHGSYI
jgi:hypothetical protein